MLHDIILDEELEVFALYNNGTTQVYFYTERKNDLAFNQKSIKIKFCENGVNSDLKMI